jgi:tetratricopeptide (TPR) repeat protein
VLAEVRVTLGNTYFMLSQYDAADQLLRTAVADHRRLFGDRALATGIALSTLGGLCAWTSRSDEAVPLLEEAAGILRRHLPVSAHELNVALQYLATAHTHAGRFEPAEAPLREALQVARDYEGDESAAATSIRGDLATVLEATGRRSEARDILKQVIARMRQIPTERMNLAAVLGKWSDLVLSLNDIAEAERAMRECVELRREVFGERSLPMATALGRLAYVQYRRDELKEAETNAREALSIQLAGLKPGERDFIFTVRPLGLVLLKTGRATEAEPLLREAFELARKYASTRTEMISELETSLKSLKSSEGR